MLDERFTQELQAWLDTPSDSRNLATGAELLLRLNKNRWMHQMILKKRNFSKLEHELKKYLAIRLEGLTKREVVAMEQTVLPLATESLELGAPVITTDAELPKGNYRGKRQDHDTLPQELQDLYERNGDIYFKMKQLFETLKQMENDTPCDRHEYLKQLDELDKAYRQNWETYDTWSAEQAVKPVTDAPTAQQLQAARKYISANKKKLAETGEEELREKIQQRIDLLLSAEQGFDADYQAELEELGLTFVAH